MLQKMSKHAIVNQGSKQDAHSEILDIVKESCQFDSCLPYQWIQNKVAEQHWQNKHVNCQQW